MTASLVTPGSIVGNTTDHTAGDGAVVHNEHIVSTVIGYPAVHEVTISLSPEKPMVAPQIGDTAFVLVEKLQEKPGQAHSLHHEYNSC